MTARAIYWAARHKRREVFVGMSTLKAIYGQDVAPSFADWYLGESGYDSQQTAEPVSPHRPDNLFEPVPGDFSARGILNERAKTFSLQSWIDLNRWPSALMAGGIIGPGAYLRKKNE